MPKIDNCLLWTVFEVLILLATIEAGRLSIILGCILGCVLIRVVFEDGKYGWSLAPESVDVTYNDFEGCEDEPFGE